MKKLFILALSLAFCCGTLTFAACKKDDPAPQSSSSAPTSETSSETSSESSIESSSLSESSENSSSLSDDLSSLDMMD
ncbi:MAG: hypothetical protein IJ373_05180 [Clostridia bacterium]|nr:hypothetical protein [Clostridia bacterium]MBQ8446574.1 hypothetical protein [Clostridia bacterium]